ncbi:hypothetical protein GHT09_002504 [Marmota monax]|uniref:Citrate transporter-like domain-containing protein n=1 Tax=Marmota monax TaxID=9995 RepID=A0A834PTR2_MARMO|nr:hypothetical protein GHT09_002504 [Marmota monax]
MKLLSYILAYRQFLLVVFSVLVLLPLPLVLHAKEAECAYVLFVVAIFWITEALPLSVTALLPGLMFPMFGIMRSTHVASAYFKDFHLLLIGVICLATSIEKWNLHKRIALRMVMMVGVNPARLTLGFMSSTALLSMWLSNTSTTAMVMPIVEAVAQQIIRAEAEAEATQMTYYNESANRVLEVDETVIGQETNKKKEKTKPKYSNDAEKVSSKMDMEKNSITGAKYRSKKDHMMCKLMCLSIAYSSTIGGLTTTTGTSTNLIFTEHFNTVKTQIEHFVKIDGPDTHCLINLPKVSGLSKWIGNKLSPLGSLPVWLIILISSLMVTSLTEVASNPATITILFPILAPLSEAIHVNPLHILLPSTLCTSFAFLLPVANPPNAIVFSYGHLKVIDMVKAGLGVNILGVAVVMLGMFTWIEPMFDLNTYPSWAPAIVNDTMP